MEMAVIGRLCALFMVFFGAALLFVPDVFPTWFTEFIASFLEVSLFGAVIAIVGLVMLAYRLLTSTPNRHPRRASRPTPKRNSTNSTSSTTADSSSVSTDSKIEDEQKEPDSAPTNVPSKLPSTRVKRAPPLATGHQKAQRITASTSPFRPDNSTGRSAPPKRTALKTTSQRSAPSAQANNEFIKPIDYDRSIRFADVDMEFSYVDVDITPELLDLDLVPDIVEVDMGPSAVSPDLVRSHIEIKISFLMKNLVHPTPPSTGPAQTERNTRSKKSEHTRSHDITTHNRTSKGRTTRYSRVNSYREQEPTMHQHRQGVEYLETDDRTMGAKSSMQSGDVDMSSYSTPEAYDYSGCKPVDLLDDEIFDQEIFSEWESGMEEEMVGIHGTDVVDEPATHLVQDEELSVSYQSDLNQEYSLPRVDPPQVHGLNLPEFGDFRAMLREPDAPFMDAVESCSRRSENLSVFSGENRDYKPESPVAVPDLDRGIDEDVFGLDWFEESVDKARSSFCLLDEKAANPLFPELEEDYFDETDDWLTY